MMKIELGDDERCKPLTKKEIAWLERLQKCFDACPSGRLEAYTIGDNDIAIYDHDSHEKQEKIGGEKDVIDHLAKSGSFIARIYTPFVILSAAG